MWVAIGAIAVVVLIIAVLLRPPRPSSADGPLPPDVEAQVLLGEEPEKDEQASSPVDDDEPHR
jgi:hypothetical protein